MSHRLWPFLLLLPLFALAEVHRLSLEQVVELAGRQNPDVLLARLEEQRATEAVGVARDPFLPKVFAGSGLAYTSGFPMSIEGSAPSIIQVRGVQTLYNKPKSFEVAQARENARAAALDVSARRDEAVFRAATLYLDLEHMYRTADLLARQTESLNRQLEFVRARVAEGRELEIEARKAALALEQSRQSEAALTADRRHLESVLATVLGLPAEDRVVPSLGDRPPITAPLSEQDVINQALAASTELKKLESAMHAQRLAQKQADASRYPQIDLVAQYALFARYNRYEDFFRRFERNNAQLGVSFTLPLFAGSAYKSQSAQASLELRKLETQFSATRERTVLEARRALAALQKARGAQDVARLELEVAREQTNISLAQFEEGRISLRQLEQIRAQETAKWMAFYEAQHTLETAWLTLLRQTGELMSALTTTNSQP